MDEFNFDSVVIEQLRVLIYQFARENPTEIDIYDVQQRISAPEAEKLEEENLFSVAVPNWMLRRLLKSAKIRGDPKSALEKFKEIFAFRKQYKLSRMTTENICTVEFYKILPFVIDGFDRDGNQLFIIRLKLFKNLPQFDLLSKHLLLFFMEQQDLALEQGDIPGIMLILDCQEFNYRNVNMNMIHFIISMGFKFPGLIKKVLIYELAWAFSFLLGMAEKVINSQIDPGRKLLFQANKNTLREFIAEEELPEFLPNGKKQLKREIPETARPFLEVIQDELYRDMLEEKNILKINEYFQSLC